MLTEEKYNEIISNLALHLNDCSDVVNANLIPYDSYFTSTGKWDSRKKGFKTHVTIGLYNLSGERAVKIIADTFTKLDVWLKEWNKSIFFSDYTIVNVAAGNPRLEFQLYFDDLTTSAKKLLLR